MRKFFFLLIMVTSFNLIIHAEGNESEQLLRKNEIKLNLPTTLLSHFFELSYERIVSSDFSIGSSTGINLEDADFFPKFTITPFARWFFGGNRRSMNKAASGFLIELNTSINQQIDFKYNQGYSSEEKVLCFGIGTSIGWKYISSNNWSSEIILGLGRNIGHDSFYPRIGVSIGKRF